MASSKYSTSWHDTNRGVSMFVLIYVALYLLVVYLSKLLHANSRISRYLPEAGMVLLVGMVAGCICELVATTSDQVAGDIAESVLSFDSSIFFIVLLPPIIFNSGYHLHPELFYRFFTPICLFAFVGTMTSMVLVACMLHWVCSFMPNFSPTFNELLAFGALISATDPVSTLAVFSAKKVDPQLFYLLSGESLLNDAVGLVLFEAFAHAVERKNPEGQGDANATGQGVQVLFEVLVNFGGSSILGFFLAFMVSYGLKKIDLLHTPLLELSAYVLIMYAPFVIAEVCRLSGIVTVLFTGLAARRYAAPNLSPFSAESSDTIFRLVAHFTETLIFLELGLSVINILQNGFNVFFVFSALLACVVSRALNVYPIALCYNLSQRLLYGQKQDMETSMLSAPVEGGLEAQPDDAHSGLAETKRVLKVQQNTIIPRGTTHFLFLSGLRGAVSYGLVKTFPDNYGNKISFEGTTMFIVLFTTFLFGGLTDFFLEKLAIPVGVDEDVYMDSLHQMMPAKRSFWRRFESTHLLPFLLRTYTPPVTPGEDEEPIYTDNIEMTEKDFKAVVDQKKAKFSIYDFGQ